MGVTKMDVQKWALDALHYSLAAGRLQAEADQTGSGEKMIRAIAARAMADRALRDGFEWVAQAGPGECPACTLRQPLGGETGEEGEE